MRRIITVCGGWRWLLAALVALTFAQPAAALYLDEDQNVSLRTRIYSQASISTNRSQDDTTPTFKQGQLVQNRFFFNPELEAKLTSYTAWMKGAGMSGVAPDDLSFRLAAWGFYDGIYDYGASQYSSTASAINRGYPTISPDVASRRAFQLAGPSFVFPGVCSISHNGCSASNQCPIQGESCIKSAGTPSLADLLPGVNVQNPHDIYATQRRVNELYMSYSKGPVFFRIGRQAISWGESDTIALLDQNNPFDITLGAPGVFEDVDEARIPLWTIRASLNLFDTLGPLSSGFIESYWVPGDLDVNTGTLPILTASPYSAPGKDPQSLVGVLPYQFVLLDRTPHYNFSNSRWGVRLQSVVDRTHTLSLWYYTAFPTQPAPQALSSTVINQRDADGQQLRAFVTQTVHTLTGVVGAADTFFLEPLDSIVRLEGEFFMHEPGFNPTYNLNIQAGGSPVAILSAPPGKILYADHLRWEVGVDRFFFLRLLNPSNSFVFVSAIVGDWNLSEGGHVNYNGAPIKRDYYQTGQTKQNGSGQDPSSFVQEKPVEAFGQVHLQTDYLHGRLTPAITFIQNVRGTWAVLPNITYRWTDWLLFSMNYVTIGGEFQQLGFFRDRDQLQFRATYQLN
ncbi:MAG: DUF1302 family protein [Deltaproteobacteria bacterium]|nr:DUF1302 family protein [Deltaproteobacteria bacterium]MBI3388268.1 DUF1302 family protein [Deltaproteobacteria bacterium]